MSVFAAKVGKLSQDPAFRARKRRQTVAANLAAAVGACGLTRAKLAIKAGIKPAQLTRQLSGSTNLTLDSIGKICEAAGVEFDVVFRNADAARHVQPWESTRVPRVAAEPVQEFKTVMKKLDVSLVMLAECRSRVNDGHMAIAMDSLAAGWADIYGQRHEHLSEPICSWPKGYKLQRDVEYLCASGDRGVDVFMALPLSQSRMVHENG